jgi:hypothetical protein
MNWKGIFLDVSNILNERSMKRNNFDLFLFCDFSVEFHVSSDVSRELFAVGEFRVLRFLLKGTKDTQRKRTSRCTSAFLSKEMFLRLMPFLCYAWF